MLVEAAEEGGGGGGGGGVGGGWWWTWWSCGAVSHFWVVNDQCVCVRASEIERWRRGNEGRSEIRGGKKGWNRGWR